MDPVSAIGLLGSVVGIVDVITKSVAYLSRLQSRYKIADLKVWLLIAQLSTLKAALDQVAELLNSKPEIPRDIRFINDLSVALSCVEAVIFALDDRLSELQRNENQGLKTLSKTRFVWDEQTINDYQSLLNNQVNALNLFLTALQCRTTVEQTKVTERLEFQSLLRLVRDDTSSLLWLRDSESIGTYRSVGPQDLGTIDTTFGFDTEVFASKVYRTATRSSMLHNLISDATAGEQQGSISPTAGQAESPVADHLPRDQLGTGNTPSPVEYPGTLKNTKLERPTMSSTLPRYTTYNLEALQSLPLAPPPSMASPVPHTRQQRVEGRNARLANPWLAKPFGQSLRATSPSQKATPGVKVIIMGISESGKSTLLKSLKMGYLGGYSHEERRNSTKSMRYNLWMVTRTNTVENRVGYEGLDGKISEILRGDHTRFIAACDVIEASRRDALFEKEESVGGPPGSILSTDVSSAIQTIWDQAQSHQVLGRDISSTECYTMDCANHFASSSNRILDPSYLPTDEDILWARTLTRGIYETKVVHDHTLYRFFDLGGIREERRKWIHVFENVDAIIFTFDVSCYDMVLLEESSQNRMMEQLLLFDSIVNSAWFVGKSQIIVLFTKDDKLTARKLLASPVQNHFPEYNGHPQDVEDILNYWVFRLGLILRHDKIKTAFCRSNSISSSTISMGEVAMNAIQRRGNFPPSI